MLAKLRALSLSALLAVSALAQTPPPTLDPAPGLAGWTAQDLQRVQQALAKRPTVPPGSVRITVTDSATGRPISGASVTLAPPGIEINGFTSSRIFALRAVVDDGKVPPITATTNAAGIAEFPKALAGTYAVGAVTAPGYAFLPPDPANPLVAPINVASGQLSTATATVSAFAAIEGTVVDQDNNPIPRIAVQVVQLRHNASTGLTSLLGITGVKTTPADANGRFRVYDIPPGHYYLRAEGGTFAPSYYPNGNLAQATPIKIAPGTPNNFNLRMRPATPFRIRGQVLGMNTGRPTAASCAAQNVNFGATVDAERFFELNNLLPGLYCLSQFDTSTFSVSGPGSRGFATVLVTDRDVSNVIVNVQKPFQISGTFTGAGVPSFELAPLANFSSTRPEFDSEKRTVTIPAVNAGDYRLRDTSSTGTFIKSIKHGNRDVPDGILHIRSAGEPLSLETAPANGLLNVRIQGTAAVVLLPQGSYEGRTDLIRTAAGSGTVELRDLPTIPYRVFALTQFDPNYSTLPTFLAMLPGQSVNVSGNAASIEARVVTPQQIDEALSRLNPPGYPAPPDVVIGSTSGGSAEPTPQPAKPATPVPSPAVTPQSASLGTISLTITDAQSGQPVPQATVNFARSGGGGGPFRAQSSATGEVRIPNLQPGDYFLSSVQSTTHAYVSTNLRTAPSPIISVPGPGVVQAGSFSVSRTGAIEGTLRNQRGEPVQGVFASVLSYTAVEGGSVLRQPFTNQALTDDRGVFRLAGLPTPGRYFLVATTNPGIPTNANSLNQPVYATTFYPGVLSPDGAGRIDLAPGASVNRIDFMVAEAPRLSVTVRTNPPVDPPNIRIRSCNPGTLDDYGTRVSSRLLTPTDRTFLEYFNVPPGTYCITFTPAAGPTAPAAAAQARQATLRGEGVVFDTATVTVSNTNITTTVSSVPPASLTGTVKVPSGTPMPAAIDLVPVSQPGPATSIPVNPSTGAFELAQLSRIPFRIVPRGVPDGLYMKSDATLDGAKHEGPLTLEFAAATASLTGRVTGATGPLTITLAPTNNRADLTRTTTANAQGEFELKNLAPGSYNAYAWPSSDPRLPTLSDFRALLQSTPVAITDKPATIEVKAITSQQLNEALARY